MPSLKPDREKILEEIRCMDLGRVNIMEVCGTHTMEIAKAGIKQLLPDNIRLLSGPGCPVCVTPQEVIDAILELSGRPGVIITTYGDMIRVPGSVPGDNLARRRALGARVRVVYSPMDAIDIARENPSDQVVFLGVGFETTAPGTAAAIGAAAAEGIKNFSVLSMLKTVEPALRALIAGEHFNVQGFLCPGHVAVIIGEDGFRFLADEYRIPGVISGFEPDEIWTAIYMLLKQIETDSPRLENAYTRLVSEHGNTLAADMMRRYLVPRDDIWRGLGTIPMSGLGIRPEFAEYDAEIRFGLTYAPAAENPLCRCGDVIRGELDPAECPMFGKVCVPEDPVGPCMVSSEGACAAAYKYRGI